MKQSLDKKWDMIVANAHMVKHKKKEGREDRTAAFWLKKVTNLSSHGDSVLDETRKLKVVLSGEVVEATSKLLMATSAIDSDAAVSAADNGSESLDSSESGDGGGETSEESVEDVSSLSD